jgi:hypothetical protein
MSLLVLFACKDARVEPQPPPATSVVASASVIVVTSEPVVDASVEASAPELPRCFEPKRIVQRGTVKDDTATWNGDFVLTRTTHLDPETLAPHAPPPRVSRRDDTFIATGERVEARNGHVIAGVRWSRELDPESESFGRVEGLRWVVITTPGKRHMVERVIDGLSGRVDPRRFEGILGDRAILESETDSDATVVNLATGKLVRHQPPCTAGERVDWSLSPGFLECASNRFGANLFALDGGKDISVDQATSLSPDHRYLVHRPGVSWEGSLLSPDRVSYERVGGGRTITLTKDVPPVTEESPRLSVTVPIAFCGEGELFAIVTQRDLVIHRGKDGARLASARAMPDGGIEFSASGRYVLFTRAGAATVYRLDP